MLLGGEELPAATIELGWAGIPWGPATRVEWCAMDSRW